MDVNEQDPFGDEMNTGQVLAAAAGVASLLGGALLLARRRREQEEIPAKAERVAKDAGRLAEDVADLTGAVAGQAQAAVAKQGRRAKKMSKGAQAAAAESTKRAQAAAAEGTKRAKLLGWRTATTVREAAPQVAASAVSEVKPLAARASEASDTVVSVGMRLGDEMAHSSKALAEKAGQVARKLTDEVVPQTTHLVRDEMLPRLRDEVIPQVSETVRKDVVPAVTQAAEKATATVTEAAVIGRKQLAEAAKKAREEGGAIADDVATVAGDRAKKMRKQGGLFGRKARAGAGEMAAALTAAGAAGLATSGKAGKEAKKARKENEKAARAAKRSARKASSAVGSFVGDSVGSLFWLATALGLLLFAFADKEQRESIINSVKTFYEQATELYRDFQGYSEEI